MKIDNLKNTYFEYRFSKELKKLINETQNYSYFLNNAEIEKWGKEYNNYFLNIKEKINSVTATNKEKYEYETYKHYAGYVSEIMNGILRKDIYVMSPEVFLPRIECLENSLNKFILKTNILVIRRLPLKHFNIKIKKGDILTEKGFLSTSLNLYSRLNIESDYQKIKNEVLMILKIPKTTNACYIEQISKREEYELLIQREQKIKILKNRKVLNNRIVIGKLIK